MRQTLPELQLSIQYPSGKAHAPTRTQVRRWVRASGHAVYKAPAQITVRFVDAAEGQELNRRWRAKDYATNVLSFPYQHDEALLCGDLIICPAVVLREAEEQKKPLDAHFAHLIVHGMLHLQGFDHETHADDAAIMEAKERGILQTLGYPDPYA
ncbi:MAG: rRNA maturation RNase YbeY [Rugosibacter sp.]|jgi:probable rRNA maturation factor|nr:putative rRNA maturation factor [Rugosibacter sp.]